MKNPDRIRGPRWAAAMLVVGASMLAPESARADEPYDDGPATMPYQGPDAVPSGYHVESQPRWGLVAPGIALGSVLWVTSIVAAIRLDTEKNQTIVDQQGGVREDPAYSARYTPMFIPIVGPFLAIPTSNASGTGAAILALDGALQVGSLAMAVAGFVAPKKELVKDRAAPKVTVTPFASGSMAGFGLAGRM